MTWVSELERRLTHLLAPIFTFINIPGDASDGIGGG